MNRPVPKDPALRQRTNRVPGAAVLTLEGRARRRKPVLPNRGIEQGWHSLTRAWWRDVWRSPMAGEYLDQDIHRLFLVADLIDAYWHKPSITLAAEIRQQSACFGLTPIDRRRLQWEVERAEQATRRRLPPAVPSPTDDPRQYLQAVK